MHHYFSKIYPVHFYLRAWIADFVKIISESGKLEQPYRGAYRYVITLMFAHTCPRDACRNCVGQDILPAFRSLGACVRVVAVLARVAW